MKLSYNWLKELVPELTATPEEVAEKLTMHAYETKVAAKMVIDPAIRVVKIVKIEPHPNADRLRLATVTDGGQEVRVVCGAPNIEEGQIVPYAPPGAHAYDAAGGVFTIKEAVIRGTKSPGMLGSARDIGLGGEHGGIFVLPSDLPLGSPLSNHFPDDTILETEITPNRAHDSLSYIGVAREIAGMFGTTTHEPELVALPAAAEDVEGFTVTVANATDTPRYMNIFLTNVRPTASPPWLQARLLASGLRPINVVVDVTNYVLLEWGQPSHAFDADALPGKVTGVREAQPHETLKLLDGQHIDLPRGALVITSDDTPVALAGIMGGAGAHVGESTSRLLLEIANFRPFAIHRVAAALNVRTEASARFAKGVSPDLVAPAAARLVALLQELTGATPQGVLDYYPAPVSPATITFSPEKVSRVVGMSVTAEQSQQALERVRCTVDTTHSPWQVTPPHDRLDLVGEHDLVEEVVRVIGLQNIPTAPVSTLTHQAQPAPAPIWRESIRDVLVTQGFTETYGVDFEPAALAALFPDQSPRVVISNPIAPEQAILRTSLLPGLAANFSTNKDDFHKKFARQTKALFEIGHVYEKSTDPNTAVPGIREEERLAGMIVGTKDTVTTLIQALEEQLGIKLDDNLIVYADELPAEVLKKMKYRVPVAAFEINLTALYQKLPPTLVARPTLADLSREAVAASSSARYQEFSRYPSVLRDVSFLVEPGVTVEQAQEMIERVGGELVADTELFDEFTPPDGGQTGFAFHIEYRALDRTLTGEEIEGVHNRIIKALEAELGAHIR